MNLLTETEEALKSHGKTFGDVLFIVGNGNEIYKDDFIRIASNFEYEDGYGHQYVPDDIKIVGNGWWLERGEYDGLEWWEFKTQPQHPGGVRRLVAINGDEWGSEKYVYGEGGAPCGSTR